MAASRYKAGDYRNAVTGDYDLFAVWPPQAAYNPLGEDLRALGTVRGSQTPQEREHVAHLERTLVQTRNGPQGIRVGNIANRIRLVCGLINSEMDGPNVLWHSDESARPCVSDIDLPIAAFMPSGSVWGIESVVDFKLFIAMCVNNGFNVSINGGWLDPNPALGKAGNRNLLDSAIYGKYLPTDETFGVVNALPAYFNT